MFRKPARVLAVDRGGALDLDRVEEEALGRDLERDRGPAEGKRQGLLNSFRLEVMETTDGCLSAYYGSGFFSECGTLSG